MKTKPHTDSRRTLRSYVESHYPFPYLVSFENVHTINLI